MAEALAVVGVVASIVQLVDFSSTVLGRLDEFQSDLGEIPKSFRHIKAELPVLRNTLQQIKEAIDAGSFPDETKRALAPAIEGCMEQIGSLDVILIKSLPVPTDSRLKRGTKAIWSLHQDAKVESITKTLRGYIGTLTFYYTVASSTLQPLPITGSTLLIMYIESQLTSWLRSKARENPTMAISARPVPKLSKSTQTTSTRNWSLVYRERRICYLEDNSHVVSLALGYTRLWQNDPELDHPPKCPSVLCQ
jgi:hypothetical protein